MGFFNLVSNIIISLFFLLVAILMKLVPGNPISLFIAFFMMYAFLKFISYLPEAITSPKWSTVEGEVKESKLVKSAAQKSGIYPDLRYTYIVEGKEYISERIKVGVENLTGSRNWADQILTKYPKNDKVLVYYNQFNPEKAVLEPGFNLRILIPLIPVFILFVITWVMEWFWQIWK